MTRIALRSPMLMLVGLLLPVAPALAAATDHSAEVKRLLATAKNSGERELNLTWSESVLGGSEGAKKFEALFNRMYGTEIKVNFTPGPSMTDVAGKLAQEVAAGQKGSADLFLGTEQHYGGLWDRNVLEEYDYTRLSPRIRREFVIPRNTAVEISTILSGISYNTNMIGPADVPRKLEQVLNPRWKGKIASTQNASIFERVAMRNEWGPEKMKAFVTKLSEQVAGLTRTTEVERVVSGEFAMLVMDAGVHHTRRFQAQGAPVGHVIPEDAGTVAFLHLGVPRNAGQSNLAKLFINMAMSEAGQKIIYETYLTDHHELPGSQSAAALSDLKSKGIGLLRVDVKFVTERPEMNKLRLELVKILREKRAG